MFQAIREFRVGRPQVFAGLMLLVFLVQCLWAANTRKLSDLEYRYIAAGLEPVGNTSEQFTGQIKADLTRWDAIVKKAKISAN